MDRFPRDAFRVEYPGQDSGRSRWREPNNGFQGARCGHGFKIEKIQLRISCGDVQHSGNCLSGLRKTDIHWKLKHRSNCSLLFGLWNITKWT